jgi:hypothetical protein
MAYTQSPGRGNKVKTGNGLPSAFLQTIDGPATKKMKAQVAKKEVKGLTFAENEAAKKFATNVSGPGNAVMGNTKVNPKSGETEVKPSGNKLVKQEGGNMMIVNSRGKTIASAKANSFNSKETDALISKFNKDEASYKDYATANTIAQNSKLKMVR